LYYYPVDIKTLLFEDGVTISGGKMVKKSLRNGKAVFACGECGLAYAQKAIAERCQAWCAKHKSCNLGIIRHALDDVEKA